MILAEYLTYCVSHCKLCPVKQQKLAQSLETSLAMSQMDV